MITMKNMSRFVAVLFILAIVPTAVLAAQTNESGKPEDVGKPEDAGSKAPAIGEKVAAALSKGVAGIGNLKTKLEEKGIDTSGIDALVDQILEKIDQINGSTNKTEIRELVREARELWNQIREMVREARKAVVKGKMSKAIERAKGLFKNIDNLLEKLKEKGIDTGELESKLSEVKSALSEAEGKYGESISEAAHLMKTVREKLGEFKHELRETVEKNKDKIREEKPEDESEEEETETEEEEVEDEEETEEEDESEDESEEEEEDESEEEPEEPEPEEEE